MANTIYASFNNSANAEKAAGALLDSGVRAEDLSVVRNHSDMENASNTTVQERDRVTGEYVGTGAASGFNDTPGNVRSGTTGAFGAGTATGAGTYADTSGVVEPPITTARSTGTYAADSNLDRDNAKPDDIEGAAKHGISTTTGADAGAGAVKGAGIGLGVGVAAALASLFIPGIGLVVGGGALAVAIAGAAATTGAGAAAGAVTGYLKDQGMEDHHAQQYSDAVGQGGALLAITLPSGKVDEAIATEILDKYGATNVNSYAARGGYVA